MDDHKELVDEIESFLAKTGMAHTMFGVYVTKNGHFVGRLRKGGNMTLRTVTKVREFMASCEQHGIEETISNIKLKRKSEHD